MLLQSSQTKICSFLDMLKTKNDGPILQKSRKQKKRKRIYILLSIYCILISLLVYGTITRNIRIMSTLRIKCLDMKEVESIIADSQEILSHVEFGSLKNGVLTLFFVA